MDGKRTLPVLQSAAAGEDDGPKRPPWQWVGFGVVAIFGAWVPLAAAAGWIGSTLAARSSSDAKAAAHVGLVLVAVEALALTLGAFAGGFVVGRWGGAGIGVREAALAGLVAAAVAIGVVWASSGFEPGALVLLGVAALGSAGGGRRGARGRTRPR